MRSLLKLFAIAAIVTCLSWPFAIGASEKASEMKEKAATVNGTVIYQKEFDMAYSHFENQMKGQGKELSETEKQDMKKRVLENLIDSEILFQASQKNDVTIDEKKINDQWEKIEDRMEKDAGYKANIEKMKYSESEIKDQIRRQMAIQTYLADAFINKATVTEAEIKTYYDENKEAFHRPEQVKASHILIKGEPPSGDAEKNAARKQIEDIQKKIQNGEDFAALAQEYSQCPSSKKGGDLGYFGRGQMVKAFEDVAFGLDVGKVSDIVTTNFGYHLIKVTGKRAESTMALDEANKKIENFLKQQKIQEEIRRFVAAEKGKSKVERFIQ